MGAQSFDNKIVLINAPIGSNLSIQDWKEFASHTRDHLKSLGLPKYSKATVEIIEPQSSEKSASVSDTRAHLKSPGLPKYSKATVETREPQRSVNWASAYGIVKSVLPAAKVKVVKKPS